MAAIQLTPEQQTALKTFAAKYPDFDYSGGFAGIKKNPAAFQDFIQLWHTLGLNDGEANSRGHFSATGQGLEQDRAFWKQALMMAGVVAAPGIAYAALPGAGAVAGAGGAAAGGAGAAGGGAAAAGGGLFGKLAGPLIGAGTQLGSAAIQSHANTEAAKLEAEAAEKALALQRQMYEERRADEAGYRQIGNGAIGLLGQGMGIDMTPKPAAQPTTMAPQASGGTLASLGPPATAQAPQASQGAFTPMRAPNGMVLQIPNEKVNEATARGAQRVA